MVDRERRASHRGRVEHGFCDLYAGTRCRPVRIEVGIVNTWQYNGCADWSTIIHWCSEHLDHWQAQWETITFYDEREYLMFLLRWS